MDNRTLLRTIAKYAGGNLVGNALTIVSGLLLARSVGPEILGLFASLALVQGYVPWLLLGTGNGVGREVPFALGQGNRLRARALVAASEAWTMRVAGGCSMVLFIVAGSQAVAGRWDLATGWAVQAVAVWGVLFGHNHLQCTYRTAGDFGRLSQIQVTQGAVGLAGVGLAALWGFFGLCGRALLLAITQIGQLWHWRPFRVRPVWSKADLLHLIRVGFPIAFVGQMSVWWGTLNDTLVLSYLDHAQLGLNAIVVLGARPLSVLIRSVSRVVYPRMTQEYARSKDLRQAIRVSILPTLVLLPLVGTLVVVGWWLAPVVIPFLVPNYAAAVPALQWNLLALIPLSASSFNNIFASTGRMLPYSLALIGGIVAYVVALHLLLRVRQDLVAFAQAMVIGRTFFLLLSFAIIGVMVRCGTPSSEESKKCPVK